jgi:FkbM family methyltransferase
MHLMQARLSLSRVGKVACPSPRSLKISARSLGADVLIRSHTSDIAVLCEMANGAYRHLPAMDALTVVDLGANTGIAARWLHERYPDARLVCVEPDPGNAAILRENVRSVSATVIEACVGGSERTVSLATTTGEFGYRIAGDNGDIPVLTMPQVLERAGMTGRLDVVKCDIEGSEAELLEDCAGWLGRVQALCVECHAPYAAVNLLADLVRNGGRFRVLHTERDPAYGVETVTLVQDRGI